MKTCESCKINKELVNFGKDKRRKDGFNKRCKQCRKTFYENNKNKIISKQKEYYLLNKSKIQLKKTRIY